MGNGETVTRKGGGLPDMRFADIDQAAEWLVREGKAKSPAAAIKNLYSAQRYGRPTAYGFAWELTMPRKKKRPVIRYGGLREERRFDTVNDAARWCASQPGVEGGIVGISSNIVKICKDPKKDVCYGFQWRYAGEPPRPLVNPAVGPIVRYGGGLEEQAFHNSRECAAWLASCGETATMWAMTSSVIRVCRGKARTAYGFQWRFLGNAPVAIVRGESRKADDSVKKRKRNSIARPVFRSGGGEPVRLFADAEEAARWCVEHGIVSPSVPACAFSIRSACRDKRDAYGFAWRYAVRSVVCHRPDGTSEWFPSLDAAAAACIDDGITNSDNALVAVRQIRNACNDEAYGLKWEYRISPPSDMTDGE